MTAQATGVPASILPQRIDYRLAMMASAVLLMVVSLLAQKLLNDFANLIAYRAFDLLPFLGQLLRYLLVAVLPSIGLTLVVLALWMRPFSAAMKALERGEKLSVEGFRSALGTVVRLHYVVIACNVAAFVFAFFVCHGGRMGIDSRSPVLFLQFASGGVVCAYVQIVINNLILAEPRARLRVRYVGTYREPSEAQRSMLISLALAAYTMFTVVGVGQAINGATLLHARIGETRVATGQDFATASASYREAVAALLDMPAEHVTVVEASGSAQDSSLLVYLPILAFLAGLAVFIQLASSRYRNAQFASLEAKLHGIIEGKADLTQRLVIGQFDELGHLADTINLFIEKLKALFASFSEASEKVASSSETLRRVLVETMATTEMMVESIDSTSAQASGQAGVVLETESTLAAMLASLVRISDNVDTQASSVEQTSAAVAEMAANIQAVGRATERANEVAGGLNEVARGGRVAVDKAAEAILELEKASLRVDSIVTGISKIAAQTNLLAMNAAIEAAHAGDAGAGFAVVASEVRSLAESSGASAKDISNQIKEMKRLIAGDVVLSKEASEALGRIGRDTGSTTALIDQIASGMSEQSQGANEIVGAMSALVEASQDIRKIAEEQRRNSETMRASIGKLVLVFREIQEATKRQADGNRGIIEGITHLQSVATENQAVVGGLQSLLQGFVIKGSDQSVFKKE